MAGDSLNSGGHVDDVHVSPHYLVHPGEHIPAVGTLAETPLVQSEVSVYFTLYLPSGPKPPGGWPIRARRRRRCSAPRALAADPAVGASLQARIPSLINAPGLTSIDGVPTASPHFNVNKPLRNQPFVINDVAGAMEIQQALEFAELAAEAGIGAVPWARYLRSEPLPGSHSKAILCQFATGDQQAVNPGATAVIREGNLADATTLYRHDLAFAADPAIPKNPHLFTGQMTSPNATARSIAFGAQEQAAVFLASMGGTTLHPAPSQFFEVPIVSSLPETLGFMP